MTIRTIQEAEAALQPYVPLVAQLTGKDTTLARIKPLMQHVGNPQERLRIIHIAGTSGKTSTAYYIAAMLKAANAKVGLTVSPHVDSVTERVQIDGEPISEATFCQELGTFLDLIKVLPEQPSYFELLYAFAIWVFERQGVDYAVVETGMGGLHDATNVADRADKVCVITDIGFDHTHILGTTLAAITAQKIGIVHEANAVLMYQQSHEVMKVVRDWITPHNADLHLTTEASERAREQVPLESLSTYQQRNWLLADYVYEYVANRDNLKHLTSKELQETQLTKVPGRMDIQQWNDKTVVMDGAHNQQKMAALVESFRERFPDTRPAIMLALKEGKEYQQVVPLLAKLASHVYLTTFNTSQDLPARSINPEILARTFASLDLTIPVTVIADQEAGLQALLADPESTCLITGSFYLLSQIRKLRAY